MSSHRGLLDVIQCKDTRRIMQKALDAGWEYVGYTKSGHVEIRWPATEQLLHCATTPSDRNAWKQFARTIEKASGVTILPKVKHGRSRGKSTNGPDPQLAAARRRYVAAQAAERDRVRRQEEARERQRLAAERAAGDEQRRRDIEALMQPGYGRD